MFDLSALSATERDWFHWGLNTACDFPWPDSTPWGLVPVRFGYQDTTGVAIAKVLSSVNSDGSRSAQMLLGNLGPNSWSDVGGPHENLDRLARHTATLIHEAAHVYEHFFLSDGDRQAILDLWDWPRGWSEGAYHERATEAFGRAFPLAFSTDTRITAWMAAHQYSDRVSETIPQLRDLVLATLPDQPEPEPEPPPDPEPEEDDMPRRSSEAWWRQHWGAPCNMHDPETVTIGRAQVRVDGRAAAAFRAFEAVRARHGYEVQTDFPRIDPVTGEKGTTGTFNCRHIGNDESRPWSVHAWGCAIDVNWNANPDGSRLVTDMPKPLRDDLHALRTKSGAPVFRWGGDWDRDPRTGHSYYDAMHWEIVATPAELASGILDLNDRPNPRPSPEEDDRPMWLIESDDPDDHKVYVTDWITKRHVVNRDEANTLAFLGVKTASDGQELQVASEIIARIKTVK